MARRSEPFQPEAPIVPELAAGAVVVQVPSNRVLLLHEKEEDRWCLPKGHVDPGESLAAAAIREVREETGLRGVHLDEELGEVSYKFFRPAKGQNIYKSTVYFLARTEELNVRPESIFDRFEWLAPAEAWRRVPYETDRRILDAAIRRLGLPSSR